MMLNSKCSAGAVVLLVFLPILLMGQRAAETAVPLKNWVTPLYWQPNQAEREAAVKAAPRLQLSTNAVSNDALTFVAITPCRLLDTRGAAAGFNGIAPFSGPSIGAGVTVTIPVQSTTESTANTEPAPCGVIPTIAQAYSFNLTVVPQVSGAIDYVTLWPSNYEKPYVSTVDDPQGAIVSNAAIVPAGNPTGGINVFNFGPAVTEVIIDMNGYFAAPTDLIGNTGVGAGTLQNLTSGENNTAVGSTALSANTSGSGNAATGSGALASNTTGAGNTAMGYATLQSNLGGVDNTAIGTNALQYNTSGNYNTAEGASALGANTTGGYNTAHGYLALVGNTTGTENTANGVYALQSNTTGSTNIAIGFQAAISVSSGNSNNIHIGSPGASGDSQTIRIGTAQATTYIAGINTASVPGGVPVYVTSTGQLGTVLSSSRFKEQITDMGDTSRKLFQLRPVNFFYKPQYDDGSHLLQYGLIAEDVAKVYPEMVAYDKDGQILTVKYQMLAPMLLNEVQKQNAQIESQDLQIQKQADALQLQQEQNRKLEDRLAALEATLAGQTPTAARPTSGR